MQPGAEMNHKSVGTRAFVRGQVGTAAYGLRGHSRRGQVCQATDTTLNRKVALKILALGSSGRPDQLKLRTVRHRGALASGGAYARLGGEPCEVCSRKRSAE